MSSRFGNRFGPPCDSRIGPPHDHRGLDLLPDPGAIRASVDSITCTAHLPVSEVEYSRSLAHRKAFFSRVQEVRKSRRSPKIDQELEKQYTVASAERRDTLKPACYRGRLRTMSRSSSGLLPITQWPTSADGSDK